MGVQTGLRRPDQKRPSEHPRLTFCHRRPMHTATCTKCGWAGLRHVQAAAGASRHWRKAPEPAPNMIKVA
eukprot:9274695-Alexandrium_andersonii.AAC.2